MSESITIILVCAAIIAAVALSVLILAVYIHRYRERRRERLMEKQIEAYANQLRILSDTQKQMKMFRHDIRHHLIVLGGLARNSQDLPVLHYIEEIEGYLEQTKEFVYTGSKEIDSILNYMIQKAKDRGIHVTWKAEIPSELPVKPFDLTAILGNLLENAVRGAGQTEEKTMSIFMRADESILYIRIENSCIENSCIAVNTDAEGEFSTTKEDKAQHGIGLYSVRSMVDKNHGTLKLDRSGGRFAAEVLLYL